MTVANPSTADEDVLYCPWCGYDLRASTDGPCTECGLPIDRAALRVSAFPWAHRREMGRVRAYVKTVWQVLVGSRTLVYEAAKVQDLAAARSFARVTGTIVAIALLVPFAAAVADDGGLEFLAVPANSPGAGMWLRGWQQDVVVPWAAGITLWPVATLGLILMGLYAARAPRSLFSAAAPSRVQPERVAAIALYTTAPLVLLVPAELVVWGTGFLVSSFRGAPVTIELAMMLTLVATVIAAIGVGGTLVRGGQWLARLRHGGLMTGVAGAAGLLGFWIVVAFVLFALAPWCAGFLWLVVDSLR
jgi:hypothetical protein